MSMQKALFQLARMMMPREPEFPSLREYRLIQEKKSQLNRADRDHVCECVEYWIKKGELIRQSDGSVTNYIKL